MTSVLQGWKASTNSIVVRKGPDKNRTVCKSTRERKVRIAAYASTGEHALRERRLSSPLDGRLVSSRLIELGKKRFWGRGRAEMLAQRRPLIVASKQAAATSLWNDVLDKSSRPPGK